ncbi:hypothetical protein AAFP30_27750 [Gordonia sp. CPCC 205515]|uniref:hypothetical protein n=1 Tax=Gordonia sp. CPCC 205515 TaxID=3140791 RepID=UPI003AF4017E
MNNTASTMPRLRDQLTTQGVVSRLVVTMTGRQDYRITTTAASTDSAALQLELPDLVMQFTSAEQVQHLLGFVAFGVQASMGMVTNYAQYDPTPQQVARMRNTVTWIATPTGTATREQMTHTVIKGQTIPYLTLVFDPVALRVLDTTALRSLIDALRTAHRTAIAVFPDGRQYTADPTRRDWKPTGPEFGRRGHGWTTPDEDD